MNRFFEEYWMLAEAMLERFSDLLGVALLNQLAAGLGGVAAARFGAAILAACLITALLRRNLRPSLPEDNHDRTRLQDHRAHRLFHFIER